MKTLILNVDRDDDFGRKAKVESPIIGIAKNTEAANKLGQADPEDSDLNAIFSAIAMYNKILKEKKDVEIATICGDINVGFKSDDILAKQLEAVIAQTDAQEVVLITDGAEDEYILPIVQSRIKVTSIRRVNVKQSRELEDTYYRILKLLDDDKVLKQFVLPTALVLIVWAFFALLNMAASGFGAILLTLGTYLLIRVFHWERTISTIWDEIKSGFLTGKLFIYTGLLAIMLLFASGFLASRDIDFSSQVSLVPVLSFVANMVWGIVVAGLLITFGRAVDVYVKDKKAPWKYWIAPFSLFAFGFVSSAIFGSLHTALINWPESFDINPFFTLSFIGYASTGIMVALVGAITYHYIKDIYVTENQEIEIEKQTANLVEES